MPIFVCFVLFCFRGGVAGDMVSDFRRSEIIISSVSIRIHKLKALCSQSCLKHTEPLGGLAYLVKISSSGFVLSALHYDS